MMIMMMMMFEPLSQFLRERASKQALSRYSHLNDNNLQ